MKAVIEIEMNDDGMYQLSSPQIPGVTAEDADLGSAIKEFGEEVEAYLDGGNEVNWKQ